MAIASTIRQRERPIPKLRRLSETQRLQRYGRSGVLVQSLLLFTKGKRRTIFLSRLSNHGWEKGIFASVGCNLSSTEAAACRLPSVVILAKTRIKDDCAAISSNVDCFSVLGNSFADPSGKINGDILVAFSNHT